MKRILFVLALAFSTLSIAQVMKVVSGNFDFLKGQNEINVIVDFVDTKYHIENFSEQEFLDYKKNDFLEKRQLSVKEWEEWLSEWNNYKSNEYLTNFLKGFNRSKKIIAGRNLQTKYTMIVEPTWVFTGWHAGITFQEAKLSTIIKFVETDNPSNVLLVYETDKILGTNQTKDFFKEYGRVGSAFQTTGKRLYSDLIRKVKK